ncbi:hypothetical protein Cch01nite_24860 [Cellulomonas chitinilytica]|uniref:Uncharacterized protein n=1 Tax=Cellulomonas chitinilytica TaxID=398759 RepID=A0A919P1W5_9CELL|nr:hypothetical protein [Cellulomonas chitinilytica]GIG21762.1 hypothetical protein Cch01nite_24860 [Cellulomonas chitinilytica]
MSPNFPRLTRPAADGARPGGDTLPQSPHSQWPDDPDDPLFVPDELRPYYSADRATEMQLWESGPKHGTSNGTPYRYAAAVDIYRATIAERDGRDRAPETGGLGDGTAFRAGVEQIAATLDDTDREAYFHPARLAAARRALKHAQDRQAAQDARHQQTVCQACHESTTTTQETWLVLDAGLIAFGRSNVPIGPGGMGMGVAARLCHPCAAAVQLEAQHRAAAHALPDGRTRAEAAAAWLDANS